MQKHILTILLTLFSHTVIAQTSFNELDLDISILDRDVRIECTRGCVEQFNFDVVTFDSILKKPVGEARVSSDYGWRVHPVLKRKKFHQGVDFSVPTGTPVQAGESGTIVYAGWMSGYGNLIVIKHNAQLSTVYGHLSSFSPGIKVGSKVKRGQIIAKSGNTGRSTSPHLHYEIRVDGLAVHHQTGEAHSNQILVFSDTGVASSGSTQPVVANNKTKTTNKTKTISKTKTAKTTQTSKSKVSTARQTNGRVKAVIR